MIFVNGAPTLTGAGGTLSFAENDGVTAIDDSLSVTDVDDAKLESVTITIFSSYVRAVRMSLGSLPFVYDSAYYLSNEKSVQKVRL